MILGLQKVGFRCSFLGQTAREGREAEYQSIDWYAGC